MMEIKQIFINTNLQEISRFKELPIAILMNVSPRLSKKQKAKLLWWLAPQRHLPAQRLDKSKFCLIKQQEQPYPELLSESSSIQSSSIDQSNYYIQESSQKSSKALSQLAEQNIIDVLRLKLADKGEDESQPAAKRYKSERQTANDDEPDSQLEQSEPFSELPSSRHDLFSEVAKSQNQELTQSEQESQTKAQSQACLNRMVINRQQQIIERLKNHYLIGPFLTAVDEQLDIAPNYYKVIKNSIDLWTIQTKNKNGEYLQFSKFNEDIKRMWENSFSYNKNNPYMRKVTMNLKRFYLKLAGNQLSNSKRTLLNQLI